MGAMKIITGYRNEPHVTSEQMRAINQAIFGIEPCYIAKLDSEYNLNAEIVNANTVKISAGLLMMHGCAAYIAPGFHELLSIANGSQSMSRKDLIVARYTKDASTGVENVELAVITGTPATSNPTRPSCADNGGIDSGTTLRECALYEVNIEGITISSITPLVNTLPPRAEMLTTLSSLVTQVGTMPKLYIWNSQGELETGITGMKSKELFLFRGAGTLASDLDMGTGTRECFGIGWRPASNTVFLLTVCSASLYYCVHRTDGTGTTHRPVNLTADV